jgi:hypothetical protein
VNFKRLIFLFFILFVSIYTYGQSKVKIKFEVLFNQQQLLLNNLVFDSLSKTQFEFSGIKFYISNILIVDTLSKQTISVKNKYLIDISETSSSELSHILPNDFSCHQISFMLGLDSLTQISKDFTGILNPLNGMYWSWHSGFVNIKMEGKCSVCPTRNKEFSHFKVRKL